MEKVMRCALIVAALAAAIPARAGCVSDVKAADLAAKVFAASRVCPGMRAARDDEASDLAVAFGAVAPTDAPDASCRTLVETRSSQEWGRLVGMPAKDQSYVCGEIGKLIDGRPPLKSALRSLGLLH